MSQRVDLVAHPDRIAGLFAGKTVLITGASGFVGRALLERILHNTNVKKVYVLMKAKRGVDARTRFGTLFDDPFFAPLIAHRGIEVCAKVTLICGDVCEPNLGLSSEDRDSLIEEVDIVYHGAACVSFDMHLKRIVLINVRGTKMMLALAKEMKRIQLFVHISTTYCQPADVVVPDDFIKPPYNPHEIIRIAENIDQGSLKILTAQILGVYGNTYGFTKALAESLVQEQVNDLPVMIIRPSIILPAWKLPMPGFTDNIYGPVGSWVCFTKGLLSVCKDIEIPMNHIPLDMVVNAIMITTYNFIENTPRKAYVCNATNQLISTQEFYEVFFPAFWKRPLALGLGTPNLIYVKTRFMYFFYYYMLNVLPCAFLDLMLWLLGKKTKLIKIHILLLRATLMIHYYSTRRWYFDNNVIQQLDKDLNPREDELYPLDINKVDTDAYTTSFLEHFRTTILKEDEDIEKNKLYHFFAYIMYWLARVVFYGFCCMYAYNTGIPLLRRHCVDVYY